MGSRERLWWGPITIGQRGGGGKWAGNRRLRWWREEEVDFRSGPLNNGFLKATYVKGGPGNCPFPGRPPIHYPIGLDLLFQGIYLCYIVILQDLETGVIPVPAVTRCQEGGLRVGEGRTDEVSYETGGLVKALGLDIIARGRLHFGKVMVGFYKIAEESSQCQWVLVSGGRHTLRNL